MSEMEWPKLIAFKRLSKDCKLIDDNYSNGRSPFEKDYDKILFSSAFRRLGKKSQVHPLIDNDHIHTRLTHSLEVASVGRTLGMEVGQQIKQKLPDPNISPIHLGEIVESACLAHDIGNPPFGHAGEEAIRSWFELNMREDPKGKFKKLEFGHSADFKYYDGNAQGFRTVTKTEYDTYQGGMRLTYPTQFTMLKYPWTSLEAERNGKGKFSCFQSETDIMNEVGEELGIKKLGDNYWARHPLAHLLEAADDICYCILDLEDARELRLLTYDYLKRNLFDEYHNEDERYIEHCDRNISERRKLAFIRGLTIKKLICSVVNAFMSKYEEIMKGDFNKPLLNYCDSGSSDLIREAKNICKNHVYNHHRKIELEIGAYSCLGAMLNEFSEAAYNVVNNDLSFKSQRVIELLGINQPIGEKDMYNTLLVYMDYLAGMTDNFATHISQQILGSGKNDVTR